MRKQYAWLVCIVCAVIAIWGQSKDIEIWSSSVGSFLAASFILLAMDDNNNKNI